MMAALLGRARRVCAFSRRVAQRIVNSIVGKLNYPVPRVLGGPHPPSVPQSAPQVRIDRKALHGVSNFLQVSAVDHNARLPVQDGFTLTA
jgi:hypothetical protein